MTFVLVLLILVAAAAGGFLGELLEFAAWIIVVLVALGAVAGFLAWRAVRSFVDGRRR
ncbi:MAG: hypothetical protein ACR2HM_09835 [Acidimicrobiales bacterium]